MTFALRRILMLGCIATFMPLVAMAQGAPSAPPPVTVAKPVVRDVIDNDEFIGRFQPVDEVSVRSRVGGYLQEVHFEDGALVKKGDLLFVIDQRPFITALNQAKAALEASQSTLVFADAQYKRAQWIMSQSAVSDEELTLLSGHGPAAD